MSTSAGLTYPTGSVNHPPPSRRGRALILAVQRQQADAIEQVLEVYGGVLRGFLRAALRDPQEVEDVLQQTLADAWRRGPTYDPERSSLATWLVMIARSRVIDHLRRRVPEPHDPGNFVELVDPAAESEIDALTERWRIAGLLAAIPREESHLLALRFYRGLTQREIAERTGLALGTVKTRMTRGLERLRVALEQEEGS